MNSQELPCWRSKKGNLIRTFSNAMHTSRSSLVIRVIFLCSLTGTEFFFLDLLLSIFFNSCSFYIIFLMPTWFALQLILSDFPCFIVADCCQVLDCQCEAVEAWFFILLTLHNMFVMVTSTITFLQWLLWDKFVQLGVIQDTFHRLNDLQLFILALTQKDFFLFF